MTLSDEHEADSFDMERIIPDLLSHEDPIEHEMLDLHLARYRFASRFVSGKRVLDMACGVGYGAALLAEAGAASVIGVDHSPQALAYARAHYSRSGIEYILADANTFGVQQPFDVAVSLETIEHMPDVVAFVRHLSALVNRGGVVVGSVPTSPSSDVNPYHLHDVSADQFRRLFERSGLEVIDQLIQRQPYSPLRLFLLKRTSKRSYGFRKNMLAYYLSKPRMLAIRIGATIRSGFSNEYLVLAARKV